MAWQLFRLGRWSFLQRRLVAGIWVVLLVSGGAGALTLSGEPSDNFELSGIESTQAFDLIEERNPQVSPDGATARVVFEAPDGESLTSAANEQVIADALAELTTSGVQSVSDPFTAGTVSEDGTVAYATVSYTQAAVDLSTADTDALEAAKDHAVDAGVNVAIGGDAAAEASHPPLGEIIGIGIAFIVLALTFGSLIAAGMPLLTAIIGVGVGVLGISILTGFMDLSSTTPALGSMLGLAVGIDYALFIMSRYQHEVREGRSLEEAAGTAVGTAGCAVVFAGLTVIIALAGLSVCGVGFLTQMGLAGAAMVGLAVLIALTLLPALLGFAGHRVLTGRLVFLKDRDPEGDAPQRTAGLKWVEAVTRFKVPVVAAGVTAAAVIAIPITSMQLAVPDDASKPPDSDSRIAYDLIADNFGAGANGPLVVVVDTKNAADPAQAVNTVIADLQTLEDSRDSDIATVIPPTGSTEAATAPAQQAYTQQLQTNEYATITVVPDSGPSAQATKNLVDDIRSDLDDLPDQTGARVLVTGQTAVGVDISEELASVFPLYLAVVVGLAFMLLVIVFRSIWVPVKAALGFLLSVGVSLGATVAVFQWGWLNQFIGLDVTSPVVFILPILLIGVLFGLAMDYEVFLVTRMREAYVQGSPAYQAIVIGFQHSARVVVAAALIMVGVFAGFAFTDEVIIKTIGFALAVGVLADAFLVRMTIIPAVMAIVGARIWWMPDWLDRLVPQLDVEGEKLVERLGHPAALEPTSESGPDGDDRPKREDAANHPR